MFQPARDSRMTYSHLGSDGCLREALLAQRYDLLVLGQALFSLRLAHRGVLGILVRRSFALRDSKWGRP